MIRPVTLALALATAAAFAPQAPAAAAEYKDAQFAFSLDLDDSVWQRRITEGGDLRTECSERVCGKVSAMCTFRKFKLPFGNNGDVTVNFDSSAMAEAQRVSLAKLKATADENFGVDRMTDVPARIEKSYAPRRIGEQIFQTAEFRMSMTGTTSRYQSFVTGVPGYRLSIMCQAEDRFFDSVKSRFEGLVATVRGASL